MEEIKASELVLAPDGSLYHLRVKPENLANDIILVGDPDRVEVVAAFFEKIEFRSQNREIKVCTGSFNKKRITVLSTGMGTDNIDIVVNELDAAVNIDLNTRQVKNEKKSLNLIRLGTCGALQENIELESFVASEYAIGMDGLLHYYDFEESAFCFGMSEAFEEHTNWSFLLPNPYSVEASPELMLRLAQGLQRGITATAPGFYGPQGRVLRLNTIVPDINELLGSFCYKDLRVMNFEMETSALYGLANMLDHNALTICVAVANRVRGEFATNYHAAMQKLIKQTLERLTA